MRGLCRKISSLQTGSLLVPFETPTYTLSGLYVVEREKTHAYVSVNRSTSNSLSAT